MNRPQFLRRNSRNTFGRLRSSVPTQLRATASSVADRLPGVSVKPKPRVSRTVKILAALGVVTVIAGYIGSRRHTDETDWLREEPEVTEKPSATDVVADSMGVTAAAEDVEPEPGQ